MGTPVTVKVSGHSNTNVKSGSQLAGWEISQAQHWDRACNIDWRNEQSQERKDSRLEQRKRKKELKNACN